MKYCVEVELGQKPTESVYNALIPELPGCFPTAETFEELQHNLREVVEMWLECAKELGYETHPEPTGFILHFQTLEIGFPA